MNRTSNRINRNVFKGFSLALSISVLALGSIATQATASDRRAPIERFTEYARVIDVQPVYQQARTRQPRQECWIENEQRIVGYEQVRRHSNSGYRQSRSNRSSESVIVGSLIGGVIGNQLGRNSSSRGRTGATVAGAIIGGSIANNSDTRGSRNQRYERNNRYVESRPIYETVQVEKCKQVSKSVSKRHLQHYNVTYEYKGRTFTTQLPRDPGNRLELQVSVAPARR